MVVHSKKTPRPLTIEMEVLHNKLGAGKITDLITETIGGNEIDLYVIVLLREKVTLKIPTRGSGVSELRAANSITILPSIITTLREPGHARGRIPWPVRAQRITSKIRSGDPQKLAEVVRDLYTTAEHQTSWAEMQLYQRALNLLCEELAIMLITDVAGILAYLKQRCPEQTYKIGPFAKLHFPPPRRKSQEVP